MQFDNQKTRNVADAVAKILAGETVSEELKGQQHKIDVNKNNKIDAEDFKHLRAGKKPAEVKKEEVEQIDELKTSTLLRYQTKANQALIGGDRNKEEKRIKGIQTASYKIKNRYKVKEEIEITEEDAYDKDRYAVRNGKAVKDNPSHVGSPNYKDQPHHVWASSAEDALKKSMNKEEVEQIQEYESKDGVYTHKGTYGTAKGAEYGSTDWKKENEMAKSDFAPKKPARKKYGARQNYVRSTRVNESFSSLLSVYKEQGLKGLAEVLVKEEPTNAEYDSELNDAKAKAEGKKKQPNLAQGSVQAVKNEETEIAVIDANKVNGVKIDTIDERQMTEPEMKKREEIVKSMKKGMAGFKERYGERAKNVIYATATKQAMK